MMTRPHWHITEYGDVMTPEGRPARFSDLEPGKVLIDYRLPRKIRCTDDELWDHELKAYNVILRPQFDVMHG